MRIFVLVLVLALLGAEAEQAVVSNSIPRVNVVDGEVLDLHDGNTIRIGDTFFWFGASYGSCVECPGRNGCCSVKAGNCGFQLNHTISLATSKNLVDWTLVGSILPERPEGILFSPWVAQSAATGKFVLWFNMLPTPGGQGDFDRAYYVVAESDSPEGPFSVVNPNVTGVAFKQLPDAASVFVDAKTGKGYLAFTHEDSHINHVQELSPDLHGPLEGGGVSAQIGETNNEGAFMFSNNGVYYVGFGQCCCFCGQGSNVEVWMAPDPLGPYALAGSLVPTPSIWGAQTGAVWWTGAEWVLYGDR